MSVFRAVLVGGPLDGELLTVTGEAPPDEIPFGLIPAKALARQADAAAAHAALGEPLPLDRLQLPVEPWGTYQRLDRREGGATCYSWREDSKAESLG